MRRWGREHWWRRRRGYKQSRYYRRSLHGDSKCDFRQHHRDMHGQPHCAVNSSRMEGTACSLDFASCFCSWACAIRRCGLAPRAAIVLHLELTRFMSAAIPRRTVHTFRPTLAGNWAQPHRMIGVPLSMAIRTVAAILLGFPRIRQSMSPRTAGSSAAQQQRMHSNGSIFVHRPAEVQVHARGT